MKPARILWMTAVASLALLAGCQKSEGPPGAQKKGAPVKKDERKVEYWTCSMHPQIRADKPGTCPICGMNLVPVYSGPAGQTSSP